MVFHFQPPLVWNEISLGSFFRCFYRRLFSSSLQSNFLSRLEFGSNVFSFLLMQVFYVFLSAHWDGKLRKQRGWLCLRDSFFVFTFPECWFKTPNNNMQRSVISAEWVKSKHENLYGFLDGLLSDVIKLAGRSQRGWKTLSRRSNWVRWHKPKKQGGSMDEPEHT